MESDQFVTITASYSAGGITPADTHKVTVSNQPNQKSVNLSPDGMGQALIYPYYTTRQGLLSLFSVSNNSDDVRAVSIILFEGKASREVLGFNLYLSPHDVWIGTISDNGTGATIKAEDLSCTVPPIPQDGQYFFSLLYAGDAALDNSTDRTREGYIVIIETAVVTGTHAEWATHVAGTPNNCAALINSWIPGGDWQTTDGAVDTSPVTDGGSISGSMTIMNPVDLSGPSYSAIALANFNGTENLHSSPGTGLPNLDSAVPRSLVIRNGMGIVSNWGADGNGNGLTGADAVSAVITHEQSLQEWSSEGLPGFSTTTDIVITFPTKGFYVPNFGELSDAPFSTSLTLNGACEGVDLSLFDRDGEEPGDAVTIPGLCWGTNVITFDNASGVNSMLGVNINTGVIPGVQAGVLLIDYDYDNPSMGTSEHPWLISDEGHQYKGLPSIRLLLQNHNVQRTRKSGNE